MTELAVLTGNNKILINGVEIETKEYKGQRVITSWDISDIHKKDVAQINRQFKRNRKRFVENSDFFEITKDEFLKCQFGTLKKISNNQDNNIQLYTESGYLKIVRTFRDNFSWDIYDMLIKSYFVVVTGQVQPKQLTKIEALKMALESELENERLRIENKAQIVYSRLVNRLAGVEDGTRETVDVETLLHIKKLEDLFSKVIFESMEKQLFYKDIYRKCKALGYQLMQFMKLDMPNIYKINENQKQLGLM